jgi:serine/threonine protein kinase
LFAPRAAVACPQRAIKQYNVDAFLHRADQEVRALQRVTRKGCRYILPLEGIALMAYRERRLMVGLVMPVGKQTLGGRYKRGSRVKQEEELRALLFQMLLGVYELHFHCTWHRDLSLNNWIFCDSTPSAAFSYRSEQLMLIDLGASKLLEELHPHQALSVIYTPGFGAPEYVKKAQEMANSSAAPGELPCRGQMGQQTACCSV